MIAKLTNKLKQQKIVLSETGIAGVCPDCGHILEYRSYFQEYNCTASDCAFVADKNGNRVWDNEKRDKNLKKTFAEIERQSRVESEVLKYYGIVK